MWSINNVTQSEEHHMHITKIMFLSKPRWNLSYGCTFSIANYWPFRIRPKSFLKLFIDHSWEFTIFIIYNVIDIMNLYWVNFDILLYKPCSFRDSVMYMVFYHWCVHRKLCLAYRNHQKPKWALIRCSSFNRASQ